MRRQGNTAQGITQYYSTTYAMLCAVCGQNGRKLFYTNICRLKIIQKDYKEESQQGLLGDCLTETVSLSCIDRLSILHRKTSITAPKNLDRTDNESGHSSGYSNQYCIREASKVSKSAMALLTSAFCRSIWEMREENSCWRGRGGRGIFILPRCCIEI